MFVHDLGVYLGVSMILVHLYQVCVHGLCACVVAGMNEEGGYSRRKRAHLMINSLWAPLPCCGCMSGFVLL